MRHSLDIQHVDDSASPIDADGYPENRLSL